MKILKIIKWLFILVAMLIALLLLTLYVRHGGGENYPDLSTKALIAEEKLETVLSYDEPIGNIAVSQTERLFFTVHPESRPEKNRLMEWRDGKAVHFPNSEFQTTELATPLGISVDANNKLWVLDHGKNGLGQAKLMGFDLGNDTLMTEILFDSHSAPAGSFLQDFTVDSKGEFAYIADVSFFRKSPGIVVVDLKNKTAWRVLDKHPSVMPQDWLIRNQIKDMRFLGGILNLKPGVDGIVISKDDRWLYYAAMAHDSLFRIDTQYLRDQKISGDEREKHIERVNKKPLNDGIAIDAENTIYITDVEHQSVMISRPDGRLETLIRSNKIRWADALAWGPNGYLYIADSAIPEQMLQSKTHIAEKAPYFIYRFKPNK
jgi:sugar lactone lactonase YvrE